MPKMRRQRSEPRQWPVPNNSQTGPSDFFRIGAEGDFKDCHDPDSTGTLLVSSRTHAWPEEEDLVDEGMEVEGGSDRE
jgi:hypothetical protein